MLSFRIFGYEGLLVFFSFKLLTKTEFRVHLSSITVSLSSLQVLLGPYSRLPPSLVGGVRRTL